MERNWQVNSCLFPAPSMSVQGLLRACVKVPLLAQHWLGFLEGCQLALAFPSTFPPLLSPSLWAPCPNSS